MVSLKDIAREVGLSVSVVSRGLNPSPDANARISDETREHILETAKRLGYRRNRNAEFMRRSKSANIGVFIPEFANSLIAELLFGISEGANAAGFPLSIHAGLSRQSYIDFIRNHCEQAASGIISYSLRQYYLPELDDGLQKYCAEGGRVLILNDITEKRFTTLAMDETEGGRMAARLLLKHRCGRYLCLLNPADTENATKVGTLRARGFFEVISEAGAEVRFCPLTECLEQLSKALERGAGTCGIFAGTDVSAIRLMQAARRMGMEAGKDYFLVGYDDLDAAKLFDPPLTTIAQPFREEGRRAVEKLIRMIYGKTETNEIIAPRPVCRNTA